MDLREIVTELTRERDRIDRAIASLESGISSGRGTRSLSPKSSSRKRGITAAGRKRLSEAMKRRWAERRGKSSKPVVSTARKSSKSGGGISAAGRKRLSEMMKKRWAERKKKGQKGL